MLGKVIVVSERDFHDFDDFHSLIFLRVTENLLVSSHVGSTDLAESRKLDFVVVKLEFREKLKFMNDNLICMMCRKVVLSH